jgi:adenosylmethionine-8-amino-7-oxononanoate aminotransferase
MIGKRTSTYDTDALKQRARDHLWMAYQPPVPFEEVGGPRVLVEAEGCWMTDSDGNRYLDGVGALEACVAGHCRQSLADVAYEQMNRLEFLDVFRYTSPPAVNLAAKLAEITPGDLSRVHFTPGGSEAVETAIKVVKQYQRLIGQPGRFKIITREGAYHGCTFGAMGVDGNYFGTRPHYYEPIPSFRLIAKAPFRYARLNGRAVERDYTADALYDLEQLILSERAETIAGLIFDPLALASGVYPPPPEYMQGLRALLDKYGILLILDEVITGFARTGKMFAAEHWGIVPDVMTVSKGISSGYMPIGAAIVREKIADAFKGHPEGVLSHGQTYGGHPVACAVALANIELIENEGLVEKVARTGNYFATKLQSLSHHRAFKEVRGLGMVYGIEFATKYDDHRVEEIQKAGYPMRTICRDNGLITLTLHPGNVLFLAPPLIISQDEVDQMVDILDRSFTEYEETQL